MEVGSTEAIKQAVAADLGVSIVSRYAVVLETQVKGLCFTPVADLKLTRQLFVIYHRRRPLAHAGAAFLLVRGQMIRGIRSPPPARDARLNLSSDTVRGTRISRCLPC